MATAGSQKGFAYTKLLSISSSNADSGTSTNFLYNAGSTFQQVSRVSIQSASFFNNIYNIYNDSRGQNNTYTYSYGGTPYTFTMTPGFYNIGTIINLMNADLTNNTGGVIQWQFSSVDNYVRLNITNAVNTFILNSASSPPLGLMTTLGGGIFLVTKNYAGFSGLLQPDTIPKLSGPTVLYIRSAALSPSNGVETGGVFTNTFLAIPVTAPPLTLNLFDCKQDILCEVSYKIPRNLNFIDIQLTDRDGNIMDLHGGSVNLELRVWFNVI